MTSRPLALGLASSVHDLAFSSASIASSCSSPPVGGAGNLVAVKSLSAGSVDRNQKDSPATHSPNRCWSRQLDGDNDDQGNGKRQAAPNVERECAHRGRIGNSSHGDDSAAIKRALESIRLRANLTVLTNPPCMIGDFFSIQCLAA